MSHALVSSGEEGKAMGYRDEKQTRIAFLVVAAALAIALAVIEALAGQNNQLSTPEPQWAQHLHRVDEALRRNNVSAADRAWHDAYVAALGSRHWEGMLAVGDAARRIGDRSNTRLAAGAKARQAYLGALFRARDDRSREGLLHVAHAFAALGDTAFAIHCLRIAEPLTAADPDALTTRSITDRAGPLTIARRDPPRDTP
jgi:hypothetical protein